MKPFIVLLVLCLTIAYSHAQRTFTGTFLGQIPETVSAGVYSMYVFPPAADFNQVYYTFNETIKTCAFYTSPATTTCSTRVGTPGVKGSSSTLLNSPYSVGLTLFADSGNNMIRKHVSGSASTVAGSGVPGFADGSATFARFKGPLAVVEGKNQAIYVADTSNARVRLIQNDQVTTIAGTGEMGFSGDNGPAVSAKLTYIYGLAVNDEAIYISDVANYRIRKIYRGNITTVAGNGQPGSSAGGDDGIATSTAIDPYFSIQVSAAHEIYFSDPYGNIRVVLPDGTIQKFTTGLTGGFMITNILSSSQLAGASIDGRVYILSTQNTCTNDKYAFIGGKCVPDCFTKSLGAACGGSTRGSCTDTNVCKCNDGYTGSECESVSVVTPKTSNKNVNGAGFVKISVSLAMAVIALVASLL